MSFDHATYHEYYIAYGYGVWASCKILINIFFFFFGIFFNPKCVNIRSASIRFFFSNTAAGRANIRPNYACKLFPRPISQKEIGGVVSNIFHSYYAFSEFSLFSFKQYFTHSNEYKVFFFYFREATKALSLFLVCQHCFRAHITGPQYFLYTSTLVFRLRNYTYTRNGRVFYYFFFLFRSFRAEYFFSNYYNWKFFERRE